jgi:hypothetical protein
MLMYEGQSASLACAFLNIFAAVSRVDIPTMFLFLGFEQWPNTNCECRYDVMHHSAPCARFEIALRIFQETGEANTAHTWHAHPELCFRWASFKYRSRHATGGFHSA